MFGGKNKDKKDNINPHFSKSHILNTENKEQKIVLKFPHVSTPQTVEGICRIIETILLQKGTIDIKVAVPESFSKEKSEITAEKVEQINNFLDEISQNHKTT